MSKPLEEMSEAEMDEYFKKHHNQVVMVKICRLVVDLADKANEFNDKACALEKSEFELKKRVKELEAELAPTKPPKVEWGEWGGLFGQQESPSQSTWRSFVVRDDRQCDCGKTIKKHQSAYALIKEDRIAKVVCMYCHAKTLSPDTNSGAVKCVDLTKPVEPKKKRKGKR